MGKVMYLVHRMPFPPNKGDKVRSFHVLEQLRSQHEVFLGTFLDDPADEEHVPALAAMCADLHLERLRHPWAKLRALRGLVQHKPLSVCHYSSSGMRQWVRRTLQQHAIDACVVVSSPMAAYMQPHGASHPGFVLDLVDVDSQKWRRIAGATNWPMSWVLRRESRLLFRHERRMVATARQSLLVTPRETRLFETLAPESRGRVAVMGNGVDAQFFSPEQPHASPFRSDEQAIVFVGTMDYWPNVDAVRWFAAEVMPALRQLHPQAVFHAVGRNPTSEVQSLERSGVRVSGTVPDVRPFLQHAAAVVAPLRVSPGLPNKILESLSMGQPVVTSAACAEAIETSEHGGVLVANGIDGWIRQVGLLLTQARYKKMLSERARETVLTRFSWADQLAPLHRSLQVIREGANP
ncbi:MAG: TIGR03087 family PEP-CTERM/XrtA system glycosyltransferase [Hydrogenophaga sp.]|uniref:TIGR03087 family PEP-CTERM/XrtA system glycosyltransferase n=1 Tax=Hydrogenophaga sp. TaxID=1904254 RepID=UPI003D9BD6E5